LALNIPANFGQYYFLYFNLETEGVALKLRLFLLTSILFFGLFTVACLWSAQLPATVPANAAAGKRVWQKHNCISCHTLFGNGGYLADDLTHITSKEDPSRLVDYLVEAPVMRPNRYKRHPALTAEDARDLVEYLKFVSTIPTLGWPPQPRKAGGGS
jgi:nitric oxide reductase subunit C